MRKSLMKAAEIFAKDSYCKRNQVGAVIALEGRVMSTGFNGTPSGTQHDCEGACEHCNSTGKISMIKKDYEVLTGKKVRMNDPGLLEYMGKNEFKKKIFRQFFRLFHSYTLFFCQIEI